MDFSSAHFELREQIRSEAFRLGFDACGFAQADEVEPWAREAYRQWLAEGRQSQMDYLGNHLDLRDHPARLYPGTRTVICVALNYYPVRFQSQENPRFAYYAYGRDYHEVMRDKLRQLAAFIAPFSGDMGRVCCDTAPMRERYWAVQAGLGFIGKNAQLIIPGKGLFGRIALHTCATTRYSARCTLWRLFALSRPLPYGCALYGWAGRCPPVHFVPDYRESRRDTGRGGGSNG